MDQPRHIHFDGWMLDRKSGELMKDGARIRLQGHPLRVLEELLASPGELVTREHLIAALWPKGVVDFDTALNTTVRRLRNALGDDADRPRYIETIPRRGYRFIGTLAAQPTATPVDVATTSPSTTPAPPPRSQLPTWALLAAMGFALAAWHWWPSSAPAEGPLPPPLAAARSIAVLPFVDPGADREQRYLAEGMADEVRELLARTPGLRVIARASSSSVQEKDPDAAAVARQLDVTHLLEGSLHRSGDRFEVAARLVDPATGAELWSRTFERHAETMHDVPAEIAASVTDALRLAPAGRQRMPTDVQAYDRFLRAGYFFHRRASGDIPRARAYLEQALAIDPGFARAWAALAGVAWIETVLEMVPLEAGLGAMRDAAERALQLDPSLADAHLRLAQYRRAVGDRGRGAEHIRAAAALEPDNPLVLGFLAGDAAADGRFDEAVDLQRRAVAADPLSPLNRYNLGSFLYFAGRFEEAKAELRGTMELNPASTHYADLLCFVLALEGRFEEALALTQDLSDGLDRLQCRGLAYHGLGRQAEADVVLKALIEASRTRDPARVAEVYARRGEPDRAFEWLDLATVAASRERWMRADYRSLWMLRYSPLLEPLRADPRWDSWLASTSGPRAVTRQAARVD